MEKAKLVHTERRWYQQTTICDRFCGGGHGCLSQHIEHLARRRPDAPSTCRPERRRDIGAAIRPSRSCIRTWCCLARLHLATAELAVIGRHNSSTSTIGGHRAWADTYSVALGHDADLTRPCKFWRLCLPLSTPRRCSL